MIIMTPSEDITAMIKNKIIRKLKILAQHEFIELTTRGNAAIIAALSIIPKDKIVLIPAEGGWLSYQTAPPKLGLKIEEVQCDDAIINLADLQEKLSSDTIGALLYQNPGGYFAEQPMKEIFKICHQYHCLVIMDVSGSIGTSWCDGRYADIFVGSFGEWKLVEAKAGGFISSDDPKIWVKIIPTLEILQSEDTMHKISQNLDLLKERITFLQEKAAQVKKDLRHLNVLHPSTPGFVVVITFNSEEEKNAITNYCKKHQLEWTECPRYIRLNQAAISIEIKRLS